VVLARSDAPIRTNLNAAQGRLSMHANGSTVTGWRQARVSAARSTTRTEEDTTMDIPQERKVLTEIPGPKSREWFERRALAVPVGVSNLHPIVTARASGAIVEDVDGNRLIDFATGISVLNVGHTAPEVVAAAARQLELDTHSCFHVSANEPYIELAERLNAIAPIEGPAKTMFANSGAEAVDNAIKIARRATGRSAVVAFDHAFHGRTFMGMSLTAKVMPYKQGMGPFAPEVYRLPYAYA
jgi:4-aminobutyrate aminotransferase/(S)-3-amino-2-methylpropionate transaminase